MGIIFMSLIFLLMLVLVFSVFIIRSKIAKIHDNIENRIEMFTHIAERGGELSSIASSAVFKGAKKAFKKSKK
jgi:Na+-transporting methylmalonyl-CoA/oxaloacetate decarboxylase gamma subunit